MSMACHSKNCIRIKHIPSGHEVICDKERSQHKNKDLCIKTIRAKLNADQLGLQRPIINEDCSDTICPICEQGILRQVGEYIRYSYNSGFRQDINGDYKVLSLYLVCDGGCGSEQADGFCADYNSETMKLLYRMKEK